MTYARAAQAWLQTDAGLMLVTVPDQVAADSTRWARSGRRFWALTPTQQKIYVRLTPDASLILA